MSGQGALALMLLLVLAGCTTPGASTTSSSGVTSSPTSEPPTFSSSPTRAKDCAEGIRPEDYWVNVFTDERVKPDNGQVAPVELRVKHLNSRAVASVRWTFVDWTGDLVNQSNADRFEGVMAVPGVYFLRLEGFDCHGELVGIDGRAYGLNQFVSELGSCDPVATKLSNSCTGLRFDIHPGHVKIHVSAPVFLGGTSNEAWWWPHRLALYDGAGTLVKEDSGSFIEVEEVGAFEHGTWTARWKPDVAVAAEIEWGAGAHADPGSVPWPTFPDGWQYKGGPWPNRPSKLE